MSFPYHARRWVEVGDFIEGRVETDARVLAPDLFWWRIPRSIHRWVSANLTPEHDFDWVIVLKGEIEQFPRSFLEHVIATMRPVFANDEFVVWSAGRTRNVTDVTVDDLIAFTRRVAALPDHPAVANSYERDPNFQADTMITRYPDLTDAEMRAAENEFFRRGGYEYPTARDRGYFADIRQNLVVALERWAGLRVLDLACGQYPLEPLPSGTVVIRVDFAEVGLRLAVEAEGGLADRHHAVMDAHQLGLSAGSFDAVAFIDASEHVRDIERVLREVARVLARDGELLVTFANRNSLNQMITRKLGYPEFVTNHHHVREFTVSDFVDELDRAGFDVVETFGVGFHPYWGVPGLDDAVRPITDADEELVDALREVGRRVGAEYAYVAVVLARKRDHTSSGSPNKSV